MIAFKIGSAGINLFFQDAGEQLAGQIVMWLELPGIGELGG